MLVRCQVCGSDVSDQAAACPKCAAEQSQFLGPESYCYECGGAMRRAYNSCASCGAPRSQNPSAEPTSTDAMHIKSKEPEPFARSKTPPSVPGYSDNSAVAESRSDGILSRFIFVVMAVIVGVFVLTMFRVVEKQHEKMPVVYTYADMEKVILDGEGANIFGLIKTEFPDDYNRFLSELVQLSNTADSFASEAAAVDAAYNLGAEFMQELMGSNMHHIATAPDKEVLAVGAVTEALYRKLEGNDGRCAALARGEAFQQTDSVYLGSTTSELLDVNFVLIEAIAAGRKRPVSRKLADDADWEELWLRYSPSLESETLDELIAVGDAFQMTDKSVCNATRVMIEEMMRDPPERQVMWIASMYGETED